jgi:PAS domain S-box-containing protein
MEGASPQNVDQVSELRKSLAWADLVLANLNEGVVVVDEKMKILFVNNAFSDMVSKPRILILGTSLCDTFPVLHEGKTLCEDEKHKTISEETTKELTGVYQLNAPDGVHIIELMVGFIPKLNQAVFVIRDITARVRAEENLKAAKSDIEHEKAKDEATLASIGDVMVAVDREAKIMLMNKVAEDILGVTMVETLGKSAYETFNLEDTKGVLIPQEKRPIFMALGSGKKVIISPTDGYIMATKKGKFPVAITVNPIILNDETIGAVQIFRDITHEREIDKAKSEFVSLASHQLRTPLTAINWYTEMLMSGDSGKVTDEQQQYLHEIYNSTKRMVDLVNALLNVSRIDLGTLSIEPEPVNLVEVAESIISELRPQIEQKKMKIVKDFGDNLPLLDGDPKLVRILFQNLLSNAVKYTPDAGQITVCVAKDQTNILMKFADTGYGIPKKQHDKIFSKLFRADNILAKETEGTGLGLYIVKAIVEQSGGNIRFESEENKGTTFFLTIPLTGMKAKKGLKALIT